MRTALWILAAPGCGGDPSPPVDVVDARPPRVDTDAPPQVVAGRLLLVECTVDPGDSDERLEGLVPTLRVVPEDSVLVRPDGGLEAVRAGALEVRCTYPDAELSDETPAVVTVLPGEPARVTATLDAATVVAGEPVTASCLVEDVHGNVTDAIPELRLAPRDPQNDVDGLTATIAKAGRYTATCWLPGAEARSAAVEVVPGLPDTLQWGLVPDRPVYAPGQTIAVAPRVTDRLDNVVREVIPVLTSEPAGRPLGPLAVRYLTDGDYTLQVEVPPPTESGAPLVAKTEIRVDGAGPAVQCDLDGRMITAVPGESVELTGTVTDPGAVAALSVEGQPVAVDPAGRFAAPIPARFGHNFVDLTAIDGFGHESAETCTFLAAPAWQPEDALVDDTTTLALFQSAIDDGDRTGPPHSIADLLAGIVDDPSILDGVDEVLLAANPLKDSCDQRILGFCAFYSRLDYRSISLAGPNTATLDLVDGGLDATVVLRNAALQLDLSGTIDSSVTLGFDAITLDLGFDLGLDESGPTAVLRSTDVTLTGLNADLGGVPDFLEGILLGLLGGSIQDLVEDTLQSQLEAQIMGLLDGLVGGLDISAFDTTIDVPRLDGAGTVPLSVGIGITHLDVTDARMRFGVGTQVSAPSGIGAPSLGVAVPAGPLLADPTTDEPAAAALHAALLGQTLHALWRAGLFEADLVDVGVPGTSASIRSVLPPVAEIADDRTVIGLGPLVVELASPELLDRPLTVVIGARAGARVTVEDGALGFGGLTVEAIHLTAVDAPLDAAERAALEDLAVALVQDLLDTVLGDAFPAVPLPSLVLPDTASGLGLPPGSALGFGSARLDNVPPHLVFTGSFEVLP